MGCSIVGNNQVLFLFVSLDRNSTFPFMFFSVLCDARFGYFFCNTAQRHCFVLVLSRCSPFLICVISTATLNRGEFRAKLRMSSRSK